MKLQPSQRASRTQSQNNAGPSKLKRASDSCKALFCGIFVIGAILNILLTTILLFGVENYHKADPIEIYEVFESPKYAQTSELLQKQQYLVLYGQPQSGILNFIEHEANTRANQSTPVIYREFEQNIFKNKIKQAKSFLQLYLGEIGKLGRGHHSWFILIKENEIPIHQIESIQKKHPHDSIILVAHQELEIQGFKNLEFPELKVKELKEFMQTDLKMDKKEVKQILNVAKQTPEIFEAFKQLELQRKTQAERLRLQKQHEQLRIRQQQEQKRLEQQENKKALEQKTLKNDQPAGKQGKNKGKKPKDQKAKTQKVKNSKSSQVEQKVQAVEQQAVEKTSNKKTSQKKPKIESQKNKKQAKKVQKEIEQKAQKIVEQVLEKEDNQGESKSKKEKKSEKGNKKNGKKDEENNVKRQSKQQKASSKTKGKKDKNAGKKSKQAAKQIQESIDQSNQQADKQGKQNHEESSVQKISQSAKNVQTTQKQL